MSSESKNLGYNSEDNFELPLDFKEHFQEKGETEKLKEKILQKLMKYSDYSI